MGESVLLPKYSKGFGTDSMVLLLALRLLAWVEDYLIRSDGKMVLLPSLTKRTHHLTFYRYSGVESPAVRAECQSLAYLHSAPSVASMNMEVCLWSVFF